MPKQVAIYKSTVGWMRTNAGQLIVAAHCMEGSSASLRLSSEQVQRYIEHSTYCSIFNLIHVIEKKTCVHGLDNNPTVYLQLKITITG